MKTVLIQIYRFVPDEYLLRQLAIEFLRCGYRSVFWSNRDQGTVGVRMIPLAASRADEALLNIPSYRFDTWPNSKSWQVFHEFLQNNYGEVPPAYEPELCYRTSRAIIESVSPDLFLCWAALDPWFRIAREVANELAVPTLVWEAGMLPNTLMLDPSGIACESSICGLKHDQLNRGSRTNAEILIENWRRETLANAGTNRPQFSKNSLYPRVLVLGSMDIAGGVHRASHCLQRTLPGFTDGVDVALKVAGAHSGTTLFRPHPNEPTKPLTRLLHSNVVCDRRTSIESQLVWADVVVGYGSKTDFHALSLGKPHVMVGFGLVSGKGCSYESRQPESLRKAIEDASSGVDEKYRKEGFVDLVDAFLTSYMYNRVPNGPCCQGLKEFAKKAVDAASLPKASAITFNDNRPWRSALSSEGNTWQKHSHTRWRLEKCLSQDQKTIDRLAQFPIGPIRFVVLDFDHTLLLGNSTEIFLNELRPRLIGELISRLGVIWAKIFNDTENVDRYRVRTAAVLMPWSLKSWRRKAKRISRDYWNQKLWDAANALNPSSIYIVSNGFEKIIKPIFSNLAIEDAQSYKLIASGLSSGSLNVRAKGKVSVMEETISNIDWSRTLVVSDSLEDFELLVRARHSVLARWSETPLKTKKGYYPMRYLRYGKFHGTGYFRKYIIEQDLIVALLLGVTSWQQVLPVTMYFFSFFAIYEIGYYENDFVAAKKEKNPTLTNQHLFFEDYPIERLGWVFALLLGFNAAILVGGSDWLLRFFFWVAVLIFTRMVFYLYNRQEPEKRIITYSVLQFAKNFGLLAVMQPVAVGMIAAVSQMFQHQLIYCVYRTGGNKEMVPRNAMRLLTFICGMAILVKLNGIETLPLSTVFLAFAWMVLHIERVYNLYRRLATRLRCRFVRLLQRNRKP